VRQQKKLEFSNLCSYYTSDEEEKELKSPYKGMAPIECSIFKSRPYIITRHTVACDNGGGSISGALQKAAMTLPFCFLGACIKSKKKKKIMQMGSFLAAQVFAGIQ
jgi:hypothetical protein